MFLGSHPAQGIEMTAPGLRSVQGIRKPTIGEMMPSHFVMPENPLVNSMIKVSKIPLSGLRGAGLGDFMGFSTNDLVKYAAIGIGAVMLMGMLKGGRGKRMKIKAQPAAPAV